MDITRLGTVAVGGGEVGRGGVAYAGEVFDVAVAWEGGILSAWEEVSVGGKGEGVPPCSGRPGMVLAPSRPTFSVRLLSALPAWTLRGWGLEIVSYLNIVRGNTARVTHGRATSRSSVFAAISSASRVFQFSSTSADGAQPRMPGWMRPANLTWGMWRLVQ